MLDRIFKFLLLVVLMNSLLIYVLFFDNKNKTSLAYKNIEVKAVENLTNLNPNELVDNKEDADKPIVVVDTTIYDNLPISGLYVDLGDEELLDNINWYYKNGDYYLFLPKAYDRTKLRVHFCDTINTSISVYNLSNELLGTIINDTETNLLKDGVVILKTDINSKKINTYKLHIMQSNLPSVSINLTNDDKDLQAVHASANHTVERQGNILVIDKEDNMLYSSLPSFKGRGNRTWERYKKPYQIKFKDKVDLFNMGKAKTYNLITNTFDGTLARNYIFFDLAQKLELDYAIEVQPVELYVNNNYMGSYLLTEKVQVKKNRIETSDEDYLLEIDNHPSGNDYIRTNRGTVITIKNPDFDDITSSDRNKIKNDARAYMNKIENLIYGNASDEELMKYIDYESFAKFYWLQELSLNYDAMRGSIYFYTKDGKLYAGPGWDFDHSLNRSYYYASTSGYYVLDNSSLASRIYNNYYRGLMKRKGFSDEVDKVYLKYKDVINNLVNVSNDYSTYIGTSANMNWTKFNYLSDARAITYRQYIYSNTSYENGVKYSLEDNIVNQDLSLSDVNYIPSSVNEVVVYGMHGDKEVELKKEVINDNKSIELELSKRTASYYKKYNRLSYYFLIERK